LLDQLCYDVGGTKHFNKLETYCLFLIIINCLQEVLDIAPVDTFGFDKGLFCSLPSSKNLSVQNGFTISSAACDCCSKLDVAER